MGEDRLPRRVMLEDVGGRRSKRRPKLRWIDNIKEDITEMGLDPETWTDAAQDRLSWRGSIEQTYGRLGPGHG
ncbi:hypothetical protein M8J77_016329 [Diaphorina citri]|nr:hypothetical protein M8J77_016329 [Diaphorina citri]